MDGYEYRITRRTLEKELYRAEMNLKNLERYRRKQKEHVIYGVVGVLLLNIVATCLGMDNVFYVVPSLYFRFVSIGVAVWTLIQIIRFLGDSGNTFFASFFGGKHVSYVVMKQEYLEKIQELEQNLYELKKKNLEEVLYDKK